MTEADKTKCIVHFRQTKETKTLLLDHEDRVRVMKAITGNRACVVRDYDWSLAAPMDVTLNGSLITFIEEVGTL